MTLKEVLKHFKTKKALADTLNISKQAVSMWKMDEDIPENHALRLRYEILPKIAESKNESAA